MILLQFCIPNFLDNQPEIYGTCTSVIFLQQLLTIDISGGLLHEATPTSCVAAQGILCDVHIPSVHCSTPPPALYSVHSKSIVLWELFSLEQVDRVVPPLECL